MKTLSKIFFGLGIAGVIFGLAYYVHYQSLPPDSSKYSFEVDGDGNDRQWILMMTLIYTFGGALMAFFCAYYFYGKARRIQS